jgi:hypothetical protein
MTTTTLMEVAAFEPTSLPHNRPARVMHATKARTLPLKQRDRSVSIPGKKKLLPTQLHRKSYGLFDELRRGNSAPQGLWAKPAAIGFSLRNRL